MNRLKQVLTAATFALALLVSACGTSASAALAKDLIPVPALQAAPWNLRPAASGRTLLPFGTDQSGAPLAPPGVPAPTAVATRQWLQGSGTLPPGPLAEGIFSVIDRAARYRTAGDAHALISGLMAGYGAAARPVTGVPGAVVLAGPFRIALPGGQATGQEALVMLERDPFVFTVLIVGGGGRPTASDAQALANLQAGAIQSPHGSP